MELKSYITHESDVYPYGVEAHGPNPNGGDPIVELHGGWPNTTEGFTEAKDYARELAREYAGYTLIHVVKVETPNVWVIRDRKKVLA